MANIRSFDLNLLRVLDALLEAGQVSAAAKTLNLSQPATSAALARLRAALDDPLLVRDGRAMVLTHRAETLRPRVRRLLAEIGETLTAPRSFDPATTDRRFRVAANDYAVHAVLAALTAASRPTRRGRRWRFCRSRKTSPSAWRTRTTTWRSATTGRCAPRAIARRCFAMTMSASPAKTIRGSRPLRRSTSFSPRATC